MKNKIKHFIVDLEELRDNYSYASDMGKNIKRIIDDLEFLIKSIETTD